MLLSDDDDINDTGTKVICDDNDSCNHVCDLDETDSEDSLTVCLLNVSRVVANFHLMTIMMSLADGSETCIGNIITKLIII